MVPAQRRGKAQQEQIKFMNNRSNHTLNSKYLACVAIALASITWPQAEAVTPAPDGGYPNRNTAEGTDALFSWPSTTSDGENTAIGFDALLQDNSGTNNTATGSFALFSNTNGSFNTASGLNALRNNNAGSSNTAAGIQALNNNTSGSNNVAVGALAGQNLTTGNNNIDISAPGNAGEANTIRIGKQGTQKSTFVAGIFGT